MCGHLEKGLGIETDSARYLDCENLPCYDCGITPSLTFLRSQTISCLLIQPNPDSALNSTAGHLLQDDYQAFARQAKLMTSIHARIPSHLKDSVLEARRRGEEVGSAIRDECDERPLIKTKPSSSSSIVIKKVRNIKPGSPGVVDSQQSTYESCSDSDIDYDEASASKENDPSQSPSPVMAPSPRRPAMAKRPLSDLPTPPEPDSGDDGATALSPSERNIVANSPYLSSPLATTSTESPRQNVKLAERSRIFNFTSRGLQDVSRDGGGTVHFDIKVDAEVEESPAQKRLCVWAEKENSTEAHMGNSKSWAPAAAARSVTGVSGVASPSPTPSRLIPHKPVAGLNMINKNAARSRMGLRRL